MKVAILGASSNVERYSYKAKTMLIQHGYEPYLVSPRYKEIDGIKTYAKLSEIESGEINTLTMYVSSKISTQLAKEIIQLSPKRVIFNPGTENAELQGELSKNGIKVIEACTLVLLSTGQFE